MPVMDGEHFLKKLKKDPIFRCISVIVISSEKKEGMSKKFLDLGAFYYLDKPVKSEILEAITISAIESTAHNFNFVKLYQAHHVVPNSLHVGKFHISKYSEVEMLSSFLSNSFPNPNRVFRGIFELLLNAVEHGLLGIGFKEKSRLLFEDKYEAEIERREALDENKEKFVEVIYKREPDGHHIQIIDQGLGFDWKNYFNLDPSSVNSVCGRGIILAKKVCFDKLIYSESGNRVTIWVSNKKADYWE